MDKNLFQYLDYKAYLRDWIGSQPAGGHGARGKIAKAIGCQTAFISQVLNGEAHLSLEQAERMKALLGHGKAEAAFFLLLVQHTRAGSEGLRRHFREQIQEALAKQSVLKDRFKATKELSKEDQTIYFSSWIFGAVHVHLSIPPYQTKEKIAENLHLPIEKVAEVLEFLVERGLASQKGDHYFMGSMHIHIGKENAYVTKHHMNWRLQAMQSIELAKGEDFHYSSVIAIAKEDAAKVKAAMADALTNARKIIEPSKEEALFGLCVDFFGL